MTSCHLFAVTGLNALIGTNNLELEDFAVEGSPCAFLTHGADWVQQDYTEGSQPGAEGLMFSFLTG